MNKCQKRNGTGEITVPVEEHMGKVLYGKEQCDECGGTGEINPNEADKE
jgi:DnaJ-class molecular chaperone